MVSNPLITLIENSDGGGGSAPPLGAEPLAPMASACHGRQGLHSPSEDSVPAAPPFKFLCSLLELEKCLVLVRVAAVLRGS